MGAAAIRRDDDGSRRRDDGDGPPPTSLSAPSLMAQAAARAHRYAVVCTLLSCAGLVGWWAASRTSGGDRVVGGGSVHVPPTAFNAGSRPLPSSASAADVASAAYAASTAANAPAVPAAPSSAPAHGGGPIGGPVLESPIDASWTVASSVLPNSVTLLGIGDWGRDNAQGQELVAPVLAAWAGATGAAAVVSVGDNVYPDGVSPEVAAAPGGADALMAAYFSRAYAQPELASIPWYVITGNHDYRGQLQPQLSWAGDARWHAGLSFTHTWPLPGGGCLAAVFTDTTPLIPYYSSPEALAAHPVLAANMGAADKDATVRWTLAALRAAARECGAVFVFGHHPLLSPGEHGDNPALRVVYDAALEAARVDAFVSGHDHLLAHSRDAPGGTEHFITGGGSLLDDLGEGNLHRSPSTRFLALKQGFTVHSVNATHVAHSFVWAGKGAPTSAVPGREAPIPGTVVHQIVRELRPKAGEDAAR